jgi:hypothetical protein
MTLPTLADRRALLRHLLLFREPRFWRLWPFLPVSRRTQEQLDLGVLYDARRMLDLGFTEVQVASPDKPLVCRDASRIYVWMPLEPNAAIEPTRNANRLVPRSNGTGETNGHHARKVAPRSPVANGHVPPEATAPDQRLGPAEVIAEAMSVRGLLKDAGTRLTNLVRALKHQRHQTRAVQQAVLSLRQLQLDK